MEIESGDLILIKFHHHRENRLGVYDDIDSFGIWIFNLAGLRKSLTFHILPNAVRKIEKVEFKNLNEYNFTDKEEIIDWFNINPVESLLTHRATSIRIFAQKSLGYE